MDHDRVMAWVDGYIRAWHAEDPAAVAQLFTEDVQYRVSPYSEPIVGQAGLEKFWLDDAGEIFSARAEPVAVDGPRAVVWVEVKYGDPVAQEYRDLWLLRFAEDGRVADFEEWAYWPDKPYSASAAG